MDDVWRGNLELGDGWAVWTGAVGDGAPHRHFAAQAVFAPEPLRVYDADGGHVMGCCVLIDPLAPHRLEPRRDARLVYLEPSRRIDDALADLLRPARAMSSLAIVAAPGGPRFWSSWLAAGTPDRGPTPRIDDALRSIDDLLPDGAVPLDAIARRAALSPERFRHLFAEEIGLPFRRYVLWRRLRLAAAELLAGRDATTAAHAAGFADAAHFARTLKATFGITAGESGLLRRVGEAA